MRFLFFLLGFFLLASPSAVRTAPSVRARRRPPFAPIPDAETHRIRIVNAVDGAIQVSDDAGQDLAA